MTRSDFNTALETFSQTQLENVLDECIIADVIPEGKYSEFDTYDKPGLIQIIHEEFPDESVDLMVAEDVEVMRSL